MKKLAILMPVLLALALPCFGSVTKQVVDADGKPVVGAVVRVVEIVPAQNEKGYTSRLVKTTRSDRNGNVILQNVDPEKFYAFMTAVEGYAPAFSHYSTKYGDREKEKQLVLYPVRPLKGRVVDDDGNPIAGAEVALSSCYAYKEGARYDYNNFANVDLGGKACSDEDGNFELNILPDGAFNYGSAHFSVTAEDRALVHVNVQHDKWGDPFEIVLRPEAIIRAKVYLPEKAGPAPEGMMFTAESSYDQQRVYAASSVGKNGLLVIKKLAAGEAGIVNASIMRDPETKKISMLPGALLAINDMQLKPGVNELELVMVPGALLKGKVVNSKTGEPAESAQVRILHGGRTKNSYIDSFETDETGEFEMRVVPGEVSVEVLNFGSNYYEGNDRPSVTVKLAEGDEKTDLVLEADPDYQPHRGASSDWEAREKPAIPGIRLEPGEYQLAWNPDIQNEFHNWRRFVSLDELEVKPKALPEFNAEEPLFGFDQFDGTGDKGKLLIAVDKSESSDDNYDIAYFDTDRDLDLSDEEPVKANHYGKFALVNSHQGQGENASNHPIKVGITVSSGDNPYYYFDKSGAWIGKIKTNMGEIEVATIDGDSNGIYGEPGKTSEDLWSVDAKDYICADINGCGSVIVANYGTQSIRLGERTSVAGVVYDISVNEAGDKLTIKPYDGPFAKLVLKPGKIRDTECSIGDIHILGSKGTYKLAMPEGGVISLPPDRYRLWGTELKFKTYSGEEMSIYCHREETFELAANETETITIEGDITSTIDPYRSETVMEQGSRTTVDWRINVGDLFAYSVGNCNESNTKVKFFDNRGKMRHMGTAGAT